MINNLDQCQVKGCFLINMYLFLIKNIIIIIITIQQYIILMFIIILIYNFQL